MKTVIFGSRTITDYELLSNVIASVQTQLNITEVISGGAKGVDSLAIQWAKEHNIPCTIMPADWNLYGRAAGSIRNKQMADIAESGIGLWDGKSKGTLNMQLTCKKVNIPCFIYRTDEKKFLDNL